MPKITFMGAGSTIFARNALGDSMLTPSLAERAIDHKHLDDGCMMLSGAMQRYTGVKTAGLCDALIETHEGWLPRYV